MLKWKKRALLRDMERGPIDWQKVSEGAKGLAARNHWAIHDYGLPQNWFYRMSQLIESWKRRCYCFWPSCELFILDAVTYISKFGGEEGIHALQQASDRAMDQHIDLRPFRRASKSWRKLLARGAGLKQDTAAQTACMIQFALAVYGWCIGQGRDSATGEALERLLNCNIHKTTAQKI